MGMLIQGGMNEAFCGAHRGFAVGLLYGNI